jgi:outer membrane protein
MGAELTFLKAIGLLGTFWALAGGTALANPLTLDDCYAAALKRSELVGLQQEAITQAEERVRQAGGAIFPTLSGSASRTWQDTTGTILTSTGNTVSLGATQPLFRGLREFAALRQAKTLRQAGFSAQKQAEVQLYKDVARAYYTVLADEKDLENLQAEIDLTSKRVAELRERIRIGRSRVSESLTVETTARAAQGGARRTGVSNRTPGPKPASLPHRGTDVRAA